MRLVTDHGRAKDENGIDEYSYFTVDVDKVESVEIVVAEESIDYCIKFGSNNLFEFMWLANVDPDEYDYIVIDQENMLNYRKCPNITNALIELGWIKPPEELRKTIPIY